MHISESVIKQIIWERDMAIQQLEEHGLHFGGLQQPMTFEEFSRPDLCSAIWMEVARDYVKGTKPVLRFDILGTPYMGMCSTGEPMPLSRYHIEDYNKTWRCWAVRPTDEERAKAKWEDFEHE